MSVSCNGIKIWVSFQYFWWFLSISIAHAQKRLYLRDSSHGDTFCAWKGFIRSRVDHFPPAISNFDVWLDLRVRTCPRHCQDKQACHVVYISRSNVILIQKILPGHRHTWSIVLSGPRKAVGWKTGIRGSLETRTEREKISWITLQNRLT